jgi:nicotinamide-nucleotide amidase
MGGGVKTNTKAQTMHTETLSIGSELTSGSTVDTNVAWLARELARLGLSVERHTLLPDSLDRVAAHMTSLRRRGQGPTILVVTGGLGPTLDDITREAVALAMDAPLQENAACRQAIEGMFRRRGWPISPSNLRQALVPTGATALPNPRGTAPGLYIAKDDLHIFVMPGVPSEMMGMFPEQVAPLIRQLVPLGKVVCERILHTFGLGESAVGEKVAALMARGRNPEVGTTVAEGLVSIRVRAVAVSETECLALLNRDEAEIQAAVGEIYIGRDEERLPQIVARLLTAKSATLATAESCTGGLLAKMVTDVPGASKFFIEGTITYANEAKMALLGVPEELLREHGAVSEAVARAMAEGMRERAAVDYALSATGIAGPTGGTPEKPVGLVFVALAGPEGTTVARLMLPGDRDRIRQRAALAALNLLRLRLQHH